MMLPKVRLLLGAVSYTLLFAVAVAAENQALLWEVRSAGNTVFILGTVHVGRADFYPLPAVIEDAYKDTAIVALEVDPTDQQALLDSMRLGVYDPPQTLEQNVSSATFEKLRRVARGLDLPLEALQSMKPFLAALMLSTQEYSRLGYDLQLGVDLHFATRAARDGKKLLQLESARSQMEMLAGLSSSLQEAFLDITLHEVSSGAMGVMLGEMIDSWKSGDVIALQRALRAEEENLPPDLAREFHEKLLTQRNTAMMSRIEQLLSGNERCLVAIGAGHLIGEDGLPALLERKGYQVRRP